MLRVGGSVCSSLGDMDPGIFKKSGEGGVLGGRLSSEVMKEGFKGKVDMRKVKETGRVGSGGIGIGW